MNNLKCRADRTLNIVIETIDHHKNHLWTEIRRDLLTSSNFDTKIKRKPKTP